MTIVTQFQKKIVERLMTGQELSAPSGPHSLGMFTWRPKGGTVSINSVLSMRNKGLVRLVKTPVKIEGINMTVEKTVVKVA